MQEPPWGDTRVQEQGILPPSEPDSENRSCPSAVGDDQETNFSRQAGFPSEAAEASELKVKPGAGRCLRAEASASSSTSDEDCSKCQVYRWKNHSKGTSQSPPGKLSDCRARMTALLQHRVAVLYGAVLIFAVGMFVCGHSLHGEYCCMPGGKVALGGRRLWLPAKGEGQEALTALEGGIKLAAGGAVGERFAWVTSAYNNSDSGWRDMLLLMLRSLRAHGAAEDTILVLEDGTLDEAFKQDLKELDCVIITRPPVQVPEWIASTVVEKRNIRNFHRLHLWGLIEYDRLVFLDADVLAARDVAPLRAIPCHSGSAQEYGTINGGVMVLCPDQALSKQLMATLYDKSKSGGRSYPVAEQSFVSFHVNWKFVSTCYNARAGDYRPFLHAFWHRHSKFWPYRDMCFLESAVLLHFNAMPKPWHPGFREEYPSAILRLYDKVTDRLQIREQR